MSKKANIFGKKIPVFLIALIAVMGLTSAALLTYFGVITGSVIVSQGLSVDGLPWDTTTLVYSADLTSLEEETVSSGNHQLRNTASVIGVVKLNSVCTATGDGCNDVTITPVFDLTTIEGSYPEGGNQVSYQDRVTAKSSTPLSEITSLTFDYDLTTTPDGKSPYFVLGLDTNEDNVVDVNVVSFQENGMSEDVWHTQEGTTRLWHGGSLSNADFALVKSTYSTAKVLQVKVMFGYWGGAYNTATALVKNIKVNSADIVKNNGLVIREYHSADPNDNEWGDVIVDFSIETYFPKMMKPATYTITTTVVPSSP